MSTIEPLWLDDAEARAWRGYMRMRTLLHARILRDLAREAGLSGPDYDVLSNVSEAEGRRARLGDLAARMAWSKSRLSHHITRMEQRGLVTREDCASDGRGAFVVLTDAGWRAIQAAAPGHVASVRRHFIDLLSREQLDALAEISQTVVSRLSDEQPS
ncbi:MAG TPA: MarR family winged helix-turn-helix transcriptional regulator [Actinomycetota bacterium]|nr:MarR family winged helix-turn-helix transcriptional regulator [Actinomycetota bacterium]